MFCYRGQILSCLLTIAIKINKFLFQIEAVDLKQESLTAYFGFAKLKTLFRKE